MACTRIRNKRNSRYTGGAGQSPPARVGDREQRLPDVGCGPHSVRHVRPVAPMTCAMTMGGPRGERGRVATRPFGRWRRRRYGPTCLAGRAPPHRDHDAIGSGSSRAASRARRAPRRRRRDLFGLDDLAADDAASGNGAAAVAGVEQPRTSSLLLRLRARTRCRSRRRGSSASPLSHLAKQVGRGDVDRLDRSRHEQHGHLDRARLAHRLGERNAIRGVDSHASMAWVCAIQRVCAADAQSLG